MGERDLRRREAKPGCDEARSTAGGPTEGCPWWVKPGRDVGHGGHEEREVG